MILDVSSICSKIDTELVTFIHNIITLIKIGVPIVLVIFGMIDFGKGVMAGKEDEIKKGQSTFIKRLIAGAIVFLMIAVSQLVTSIIDRESDGEIWSCANGIMNGTLNKELTEEEKEEKYKEERNRIINQCCNEVDGKVVSNTSKNTVSCGLNSKEQDEKYSECYNKKMDKIDEGEE